MNNELVLTVNLLGVAVAGGGLVLLAIIYFLVKWLTKEAPLPELSDLGESVLDILDNENLNWTINHNYHSIHCQESFAKDIASSVCIFYTNDPLKAFVRLNGNNLEGLNKTDKIEIAELAQEIYDNIIEEDRLKKDKVVLDTLNNFKNRT